MSFLGSLLLSPITGPVRATQFILNRIRDEVEAELPDEDAARSRLLNLSLREESGEVSPEQSQAERADILDDMNEARDIRVSLAEPPESADPTASGQ
jgi:hypothetical protein